MTEAKLQNSSVEVELLLIMSRKINSSLQEEHIARRD